MSSFIMPLAVIILLLFIFIVWRFTHKINLVTWKKALIYISAVLVVYPIVLISGYFIGLFNCSASAFWKAWEPATDIYKEIESKKLCPKTEKELSDINPTYYKLVQENARSKGYCDLVTGKYIWIVRPSAYYIMVFKDNKTGIMKVPYQLPVSHWDNVPEYKGDAQLIP
jgi:glucan phosphoethanolaminetransferase (alkaline phosphatase superfamily)